MRANVLPSFSTPHAVWLRLTAPCRWPLLWKINESHGQYMQNYGQLQDFSQCGTEICKRNLLRLHDMAKYLTPPRCTDNVHRLWAGC